MTQTHIFNPVPMFLNIYGALSLEPYALKCRMLQKKAAWSLCKDDMGNQEVFDIIKKRNTEYKAKNKFIMSIHIVYLLEEKNDFPPFPTKKAQGDREYRF